MAQKTENNARTLLFNLPKDGEKAKFDAILTRRGGSITLDDQARPHCLIYESGIVLITEQGQTMAAVQTAMMYARDTLKISLKEPQISRVDDIQSLYRRDDEMIVHASDKKEFLLNLISDGAREGVNDFHIRVSQLFRVTDLRFQKDGQSSKLYGHMTVEEGEQLLNAAFTNADSGDRQRKRGRPQQRGITDPAILPPQLMSVRMQFTPIDGGELLNMRLLYRQPFAKGEGLEAIGLPEHQIDQLRLAQIRSKGVLLVVGPTASGKTSLIDNWLIDLSKNYNGRLIIFSIADPPESAHSEMYSFPVSTDGRAQDHDPYAEALETSLRLNPEVIFVNEIRSSGTAKLAFYAANTGKPVAATMHVEDAEEVPARLRNLGLDERDIYNARSHLAWIAVRLIPILCPGCACSLDEAARTRPEKYSALLRRYQTVLGPIGHQAEAFLVAGDGCDSCMKGRASSPGTISRMQIAEIMTPSQEMLDLFRQGRNQEARSLWIGNGERSLRLTGWDLVQERKLCVHHYNRIICSPDLLIEDLSILRRHTPLALVE